MEHNLVVKLEQGFAIAIPAIFALLEGTDQIKR